MHCSLYFMRTLDRYSCQFNDLSALLKAVSFRLTWLLLERMSAESCRFLPGAIYSDAMIDALRPLSKRDEILLDSALFDVIFVLKLHSS